MLHQLHGQYKNHLHKKPNQRLPLQLRKRLKSQLPQEIHLLEHPCLEPLQLKVLLMQHSQLSGKTAELKRLGLQAQIKGAKITDFSRGKQLAPALVKPRVSRSGRFISSWASSCWPYVALSTMIVNIKRAIRQLRKTLLLPSKKYSLTQSWHLASTIISALLLVFYPESKIRQL